jgi:hypothetical protein
MVFNIYFRQTVYFIHWLFLAIFRVSGLSWREGSKITIIQTVPDCDCWCVMKVITHFSVTGTPMIKCVDSGATRLPSMSSPHPHHELCPGAAGSCFSDVMYCLQPHFSTWGGDTASQLERDYLPISPNPMRLVTEVQHYVILSSHDGPSVT